MCRVEYGTCIAIRKPLLCVFVYFDYVLVTTGIVLSLILNTYTPSCPTLLVVATLPTSLVPDVGIIPKSVPCPLLNPIWAVFPPRPLVPLSASPVVHWISPSA